MVPLIRCALLGVIAGVLTLGPVGAQSVPTDFTIESVANGIMRPVGLAFVPDGRLLVVEQDTGSVRVWSGGTSLATVGVVPNVENAGNERGLLAIAVDPGWPARPYIYLWYCHTSGFMRLRMYTVTGDLTNASSSNLMLGSSFDILTDVPDNNAPHNGGGLLFGPDGYLYLSIGDDGDACAAQDINSLLGSVVRLDVSGLPGAGAGPPPKSTLAAQGNPFSGPSDNAKLIWSYGLRNPFRFDIDPVTGRLYIADVGGSFWEEIDEVAAGGLNYGWPWFEGPSTHPGCLGPPPATVESPILSIHHSTGVASIISLCIYRNQPGGIYNFGPDYEGDYFFHDYWAGFVRRLDYDGTSWNPAAPAPGQTGSNWASNFPGCSDATVGPDGAIYYVRPSSGTLRRIVNNAPPSMSLVSGNNQPGNASYALQDPFVVQVVAGGAPLVNAQVDFAVTTGGGTVNPATVMTDASGMAQTTYTLAASYSGPPTVTASSAGSTPSVFSATWRGLEVTYDPLANSIATTVRHSQTNSPFTIAWDAPPAAPFLTSQYGDIWTSLVSPQPTLGVLDGLGLISAPNPLFTTGPTVPVWGTTFSNLPMLGGVTIIIQAYAMDLSSGVTPHSYMISNTRTITIN